ncbi:MAG: threonine synthase [Dehalococcoidia bacterium]|nr:threonine synthase [Dehalococcoidia bacterium]
MKSYAEYLECTNCHKEYDYVNPYRTCQECGKVLYVKYDMEKARKNFDRNSLVGRVSSMWRYYEMMPIKDESNIVSLGEGMTPLLKADNLGKALNCSDIYIKDEGCNPTGSFKARGLSAAVSRAKELGVTKLTMPSAGNAGGALSLYCARGNLEANVFMPKDAPIANKRESSDAGAKLTLIDGLISDAGKISREQAQEKGLFDVSTLQEPYRAEGKKTMGYEIAEQLQWDTPDVIIYPTGGGTGLIGIWKAFQEMQELGWIDKPKTRMIAVQSEGCAPIVKAYQSGALNAEMWNDAKTFAAGIRVPSAIGDYLILEAIRKSSGTALTVTDMEMMECISIMASNEGIYPAPEGAATLAALKLLLASNEVKPEEKIVLMNTGNAYKYLDMWD